MLVLPLSTADVTPSASARNTWFPRSPGSSSANVRFWNRHVSFHFRLIIFIWGIFIFLSAFNVFLSWTRSLESWFPRRTVLFYIKTHLVRWNTRRGYPVHRSPRVHRTPSCSTGIGFLQVTHTPRSLSGLDGKTRQGEVGLAVRTSITRAARPPEFISDRLLKVTLGLRGRAKAVAFFVAYAPTETHDASKKHAFWTTLDRAVKDVPRHEQLFVLMDANARTGRREKGGVGSKDNKILGAFGRDILNDNGELLLSFANNHDLAIVNTFFSTPKGGVSHTFNGRGRKRIDYILTRQYDRKLVRNVTVHPQPSFLPSHFGPQRCVRTRQAPRPFCTKPPAGGLS